MKQIPNMISGKDLLYLEDSFNWHFTLSKKAREYSEIVEDDTISNYLDDLSNTHKKICKKILNILGGTNGK